MKVWPQNPASELEAVFAEIARTRMADVPICNSVLQVEAVDFRRTADGHWAGAMITPWAINLLCLPASEENWPALAACAKYDWQFPSGNYEFTVKSDHAILLWINDLNAKRPLIDAVSPWVAGVALAPHGKLAKYQL